MADQCSNDNEYDGSDFTLRIISIFIIFGVSLLGSVGPLVLHHYYKKLNYAFYILKNIGTGVIVSTGVIHLLTDGAEALDNPCLGAPFTEYPFANGLVIFGIISIFLLHLVNFPWKGKLSTINAFVSSHDHVLEPSNIDQLENERPVRHEPGTKSKVSDDINEEINEYNYLDNETLKEEKDQITNILILEFGILLHSVIVGLAMAISLDFIPLLIAIAFHQFFEGLGLGSRFVYFPRNYYSEHRSFRKRISAYVPYILSIVYSLSTPIGIAIGLALRDTYNPDSKNGLIIVGIFNSICAGILIYSGVSLFIDVKDWIGAIALIFGAICMAIVAYWA